MNVIDEDKKKLSVAEKQANLEAKHRRAKSDYVAGAISVGHCEREKRRIKYEEKRLR